MSVRLRGHHLLCMLTFKGLGYTPAFTANLAAVLDRLAAGEAVELVDGPDDICRPRLTDPDDGDVHCHLPRIEQRDRLALEDVGARLGRPLHAGMALSLDSATLADLRRAFAEGRIRAACFDCQWGEICSAIAGEDFRDTRLQAKLNES